MSLPEPDLPEPTAQPTPQEQRHRLAISGEMFVAAQLQRLGVFASVTYGTAKRADVVCVSRDGRRAVVLEVKTTGKSRWPIGTRVPAPTDQVWVFVHLALDALSPPRYLVWEQSDMHTALSPGEKAFTERFRRRRGQDWDYSKGVACMPLDVALVRENAWATVLKRL